MNCSKKIYSKNSVKIPSSLSCNQCVLQWKWFAKFTGEVYFEFK